MEAARVAAAQVGNQLNSGAIRLVAANTALEHKARRLVLLLAVFALTAGIVGGFIGSKLAAGM
jgi:Cdc6-like AAA superfamily ATPase